MWKKGSFTSVQSKKIRRFLCAGAGSFAIFLADLPQTQAAVTVSFSGSSSDQTQLQADFLSSTTAQWIATVKPGLFSGDYKIVISKKIEDTIKTASALDECFVTGFAFGMDRERKDDLGLLDGLKDDILKTKTCGGVIHDDEAMRQAFISGCMTGYDVATSTISERNAEPIFP